MKTKLAVLSLCSAAVVMMAGPVYAQTGMDCQTITNDVMVDDPHIDMSSGGPDFGTPELNERASGQILEKYASAQDPDPESCQAIREVRAKLLSENRFAQAQCRTIVPSIKAQLRTVASEAAVLCRRVK